MGLANPQLIPINLSKGEGHEHPDIVVGKPYLAYVMGKYISGTFSRQWYGLHFDCDWGASGIQFDAPGFNLSTWEALWLLPEPDPAWVARKEERNRKVNEAREREREDEWDD